MCPQGDDEGLQWEFLFILSVILATNGDGRHYPRPTDTRLWPLPGTLILGSSCGGLPLADTAVVRHLSSALLDFPSHALSAPVSSLEGVSVLIVFLLYPQAEHNVSHM